MVATILNEFFGIYEVIFGGTQGAIAVFVPRIVCFTEKKAGTVEMDIGKVEFHGAAFGDFPSFIQIALCAFDASAST